MLGCILKSPFFRDYGTALNFTDANGTEIFNGSGASKLPKVRRNVTGDAYKVVTSGVISLPGTDRESASAR